MTDLTAPQGRQQGQEEQQGMGDGGWGKGGEQGCEAAATEVVGQLASRCFTPLNGVKIQFSH